MQEFTFACGICYFFFEFGSLSVEKFLQYRCEFIKSFSVISESGANNRIKGKLSILHFFPVQSYQDNQIYNGEQFPML